jgi:hypothetical protein
MNPNLNIKIVLKQSELTFIISGESASTVSGNGHSVPTFAVSLFTFPEYRIKTNL